MPTVSTTDKIHARIMTTGGIERDWPWPRSFLSPSWSCRLGSCPSAASFKVDWAASAETSRATLRACGGAAGGVLAALSTGGNGIGTAAAGSHRSERRYRGEISPRRDLRQRGGTRCGYRRRACRSGTGKCRRGRRPARRRGDGRYGRGNFRQGERACRQRSGRIADRRIERSIFRNPKATLAARTACVAAGQLIGHRQRLLATRALSSNGH